LKSGKLLPRAGSWAELRRRILEQIVPGEGERKRIEAFCRRTERALTGRLRDAGIKADAEVHGSVARGTWLSDERDIDIFMVLDEGYGREMLPRVLGVVKEYVGEGWVEAYAEHPYVSARMEGFNVEFVPCFRVDPGQGLVSATDRTPLHTRYVNEHLPPDDRDEVRLLKRFMKGVEVYGAEVKVGGFSGYLCELLVIHLGSFESVLEEASSWRRGEALDVVGGADAAALSKFGDPLVVLDPVDWGRNVASAVSETAFWTLTVAARAFIRGPDEAFFYPRESAVDVPKLLGDIRGRGSGLLFVVFDDERVGVPDVLWGQLYKTERALNGLLAKSGFRVFRSAVWSDESTRHIIVFELESAALPGTMKRIGPPVSMPEDSERFVRAHLGAEETVSGPWIEGGRWWVETRRPETSARGLIAEMLRDGGGGIGISRKLMRKIGGGYKVLLGEEIGGCLVPGFSGFLDRFLRGRPAWLG
jgi:tRNA nucleotidyltransferase (CCA-adding enzyme)